MADYTYLPACATEDSTNCYWDATQQGNGYGNSFVDIDGTIHYLDVPDNYYILDAVISPASPTGYAVAYQEMTPTAVDAAPAYDPTAIVVVVTAALIASAVTLIVGFVRRDKVS